MGKVLVVDDDKDILTVVKILLTNKGFSVDVTDKWEKTFEKIETFNPDVILLDIALSGQDGREICKRLKAAESTKHISVVLFSANHNMIQSVAECKANDFIAKPFETEDLVKKIRDQLPEIIN